MINEEKALEMYPKLIDMSCGALPGGEPIVVDVNLPQRKAFLAGTQWKDEQHAQEKQKLIDEACEWLTKNDSYAIPTNVQVDRLREHLNNKIKGE